MSVPQSAPVQGFLGFRLGRRGRDEAEVRMEVRGEFLQETGVVQGGVVTALADQAGVHLLLPRIGAGRSMTGVELKVNFLRPARVGEGELVATARPVRVGRTVAVCRVEVRQGGKEVAVGVFSYLVFGGPG